MPRPKKSDAPDLAEAHDLTAGLIDRLSCPPGKAQVFLRDIKAPGLRVRATPPSTKNPQGVKAFVFEAKLKRKTIRQTLGDVRAWSIEEARKEANLLRVTLDGGADPRELERQKGAEQAAAVAAEEARSVTFSDAWTAYVADRKPYWGERSYRSHLEMVLPGGAPRKRWEGKTTIAGPLASLTAKRLADVDSTELLAWAAKEAKTRPASVRHAIRLLKAFMRWCADDLRYKDVVNAGAASGKKVREVAGSASKRNDYLQREQLAAWFSHVRQLPNPIVSAYLQCLLLTGARREEMAALRWDDVNFQWHGIELRDKIEGTRQVPLTPYVEQLISSLPRRNEWVFSSVRILDEKHADRRQRYHASKGTQAPVGVIAARSASGRIEEPGRAHQQACKAAGLELTLHGLRRSFASLCEWLDIPGGISAQIQGHAPQGVREQRYIRRPLDLLRHHHERIEAWMLEQAGLDFKPRKDQPRLSVVQ
jgi:integrase